MLSDYILHRAIAKVFCWSTRTLAIALVSFFTPPAEDSWASDTKLQTLLGSVYFPSILFRIIYCSNLPYMLKLNDVVYFVTDLLIIDFDRGNATVNAIFSHYDEVNVTEFGGLKKGKLVSVDTGEWKGTQSTLINCIFLRTEFLGPCLHN